MDKTIKEYQMSAIYSLLVVLVVAILLMINSFWLPEAAENGCALCDGASEQIPYLSVCHCIICRPVSTYIFPGMAFATSCGGRFQIIKSNLFRLNPGWTSARLFH